MVEVYQKWCGRTAAVASSWRRFMLEHSEAAAVVRFAFVDATACAGVPELQPYNDTCRPAFLFIHSGAVKGAVEGVHPPRLLRCLEEQLEVAAAAASEAAASDAQPEPEADRQT